MTNNKSTDFDAIIIGAGFAGLSLIHHLKKIGLSIKVFDKTSDIGGTWTWNRYPGAMTDSEAYYYCFAFSKEILQNWSWSQRYPAWDEMHRYMHFVADECNMWPHIQLDTEITSAVYQKDSSTWLITTGDEKQYTCKYFISGMGMISDPVMPKIKGIEKFKGPCFHSARWPEGLDHVGKRIGIVGSGATTVQMLPVIAQKAASVTVFQRTPNFILPAMQKPMTPAWEKEIKENYDEIIAKCRNHVFGMAFNSSSGRNAVDTPEDERLKIFEENWNGSFRWVFETFDDLLSDPAANRMASEFIINKMKERINDPELEELLCPTLGEYPLFAKRPPLDHGYLEAYHRDNVNLVDIRNREPIVEITEKGIRTTENEFEFDIIIFATGFRAYTGSLEALTIRGDSGKTLAEKWDKTSKSIMGVCVADYPNMFTITGPQAPFANLPTSIEQNAIWISDCIKMMETEGYTVCKPKQEAEEAWSAHVSEVHVQTLMNEGDQVNSWMMGANIENHEPRVLIYFGGANVYYDKLRESVDAGFPELSFSS
jgi:cation diffusion facilitator CzcD-associated flavoprotein CzcO